MTNGIIRKEKEIKQGQMYYKVMIKRDPFFSIWREEFGSFNKDKTNEIFLKISRAKNIKMDIK